MTLGEKSSPQQGIAIIGMSCLFPKARDLDAYWRNILGKVDAVSDPPPGAWDVDLYYDPASTDSDKLYCKRGGYLADLAHFDPLAHGIPPMSVGGEPDQWLALQIARDALVDAGYAELDEAVRHRTAVILGRGAMFNGGAAIPVQHSLVVPQILQLMRELHPEFSDVDMEALRQGLKGQLPAMGPEIAPGLTPNVIVGRIANRLDLMGPSYTIDAACASSLVAVQMATRELLNGDCDLALAGGSHVWTPVPMLNLFCQLGALSHHEQIRPFDKDADGTILGEGLGMLVLKRLADAERDGDRIYAVVRGVGIASDGKANFVMAPRVEGEALAMQRAYDASGVSTSSIELIEAHGTGTPVGDVVEIQALRSVFGDRVTDLPPIALGSVKSMISHTMPAAGAAGMIKTALALYHKVLPPTLGVTEPNPRLELETTPFYISSNPRPWVHGGDEPRRAGVSAFGFGGINAHVVLEEYRPSVPATGAAPRHMPAWDSEVCVLQAQSQAELLTKAQQLKQYVEGASEGVSLQDVAYTLALDLAAGGLRLAIVSTSLADLAAKLERACTRLAEPELRQIKEIGGIYYSAQPLAGEGKLAFLYPGEGSQYANMLADLCLHFPEVRECFDATDRLFRDYGRAHVPSDFVFPRPTFSQDEADWAAAQLWDMDGAVAGVLTADEALGRILSGLGLKPDVVVGHSSGEFAALQAAGWLGDADSARAELSRLLMQVHDETQTQDDVAAAVLLAIGAERAEVEAVLAARNDGAVIAMDNCPHQVVVAVAPQHADVLQQAFASQGLIVERLAFDRAYHTQQFAAYSLRLRRSLAALPVTNSATPVYSAATAAPFATAPDAVRDLMAEQWMRPVEFRRTVESLYEDGVRLFVEVGPRSNLTAFVEDTLRRRPFAAVASNVQQRSGTLQLNHMAGLLASQGAELDLTYLFRHRDPRRLDLTGATSDAPATHRDMLLRTGITTMQMPVGMVERLRGSAAASAARVPSVAEPAAVVPQPAPVESPAASPPKPSQLPVSPPEAEAPTQPIVAAHDFLQTMEQFLAVQENIMRSYLQGGGVPVDASLPAMPASSARGETAYPLLGDILEHRPGELLRARRVFDPAEQGLIDHSFGRNISVNDPALHGLSIMPLAFMLELLAQGGSALRSDLVVSALRDVRVNRWLMFADGPQTVEITARAIDGDPASVHVTLHNLSESGTSPVCEATIVLTEALTPAGARIQLSQPQPSRVTPPELYGEIMFHGPAWQAVKAIEQTAADGIVAALTTLPTGALFTGAAASDYVMDPILLDATGQVMGFWMPEHQAGGYSVFPYRVDSISLHNATPVAGQPLTCRVLVTHLDDQLFATDMELVHPDGSLYMRIDGWLTKRVYLPGSLQQITLPPDLGAIGEPWPELVADLDVPGLEAQRLRLDVPGDQQFLARVWQFRSLSRRERAHFDSLSLSTNDQLDWLAARQVMKDAAQRLFRRRQHAYLSPSDVEVWQQPDGSSYAESSWQGLPLRASLSLAQTGGWYVAVAALADVAVSIDLRLAPASANGAFTSTLPAGAQLYLHNDLTAAISIGRLNPTGTP